MKTYAAVKQGVKVVSGKVLWLLACMSLLLSNVVLAQRSAVESINSPEFAQRVAACAGTATTVLGTWPAAGRWQDPAFPGHGWELTWYVPDGPIAPGPTARLRVHFYTYTAYNAPVGSPDVGFPVWYSADLEVQGFANTAALIATGSLYKSYRINGVESQVAVGTINFGQSTEPGNLGRERATVSITGFDDPDISYGGPVNKSLCLQTIYGGVTTYGSGQEGVWRPTAGSTLQGINQWLTPGTDFAAQRYTPTLVTFDEGGQPVWLNGDRSDTTTPDNPSANYLFKYLRGRAMFRAAQESPCPVGAMCVTLGHSANATMNVPQPSVMPGTGTITPAINIPATEPAPANCTAFAVNAQGALVQVAAIDGACKPRYPVIWQTSMSIKQTTRLADLAPISACTVPTGQSSCDLQIAWVMRNGLDARYLVVSTTVGVTNLSL